MYHLLMPQDTQQEIKNGLTYEEYKQRLEEIKQNYFDELDTLYKELVKQVEEFRKNADKRKIEELKNSMKNN